MLPVVTLFFSMLLVVLPLLKAEAAPSPSISSNWFSPSKVKAKALLVGYNAKNKRMLYVCGCYLFGSFQLGLNYNYDDNCHIPYKKRIYTVDTFYLLKNLKGKWQNVGNKQLPPKTLYLGSGLGHAPLALCRSYIHGSVIPGKTWPGLNGCKLTYLNKVHVAKDYAVFVSGS